LKKIGYILSHFSDLFQRFQPFLISKQTITSGVGNQFGSGGHFEKVPFTQRRAVPSDGNRSKYWLNY